MRDSDPERTLALSYARSHRAAAEALFALDDALADVVRTTSDPMVGQLRLTWWHEALGRLDTAPPPAERVLQALARSVLPLGVTGTMLAPMIEGWEELVAPDPIGDDMLVRYAHRRGATLFSALARVLGVTADDPAGVAGEGWALVDLAWNVRSRDDAVSALALARPRLGAATAARWSRAGRPLGALAHLARLDLRLAPDGTRRLGAPMRIARMLRHRLTGR